MNGVSVSTVDVGVGASVETAGDAVGELFAVLHGTVLGLARDITAEGNVTSGSVGADGAAILHGNATVDMGDGTVLRGVPFTATAKADSVLLTLGASALPAATLTAGTITID